MDDQFIYTTAACPVAVPAPREVWEVGVLAQDLGHSDGLQMMCLAGGLVRTLPLRDVLPLSTTISLTHDSLLRGYTLTPVVCCIVLLPQSLLLLLVLIMSALL